MADSSVSWRMGVPVGEYTAKSSETLALPCIRPDCQSRPAGWCTAIKMSTSVCLPAICVRLAQAEVLQHAGGELARHLIRRLRTVIERRDEREDARAGVGGAQHVL